MQVLPLQVLPFSRTEQCDTSEGSALYRHW